MPVGHGLGSSHSPSLAYGQESFGCPSTFRASAVGDFLPRNGFHAANPLKLQPGIRIIRKGDDFGAFGFILAASPQILPNGLNLILINAVAAIAGRPGRLAARQRGDKTILAGLQDGLAISILMTRMLAVAGIQNNRTFAIIDQVSPVRMTRGGKVFRSVRAAG